MAQLAILGHATRGKEVIEILRILGGYNLLGFDGNDTLAVYYVDTSFNNIIACYRAYEDSIIFTLEEFLENFPYKVWDKVLINDDESNVYMVKSMVWNEDFNRVVYRIEAVDGTMDKHDCFAHELVFFSPKKEETMKEKLEQITLYIPDGYEFFGINDDNKVVLTKKQTQYPKTYEECCDVLNISYPYFDAVDYCICASTYKNELFGKFKKLLICRDAYWKIAGEWTLDYDADELFFISNERGCIVKGKGTTDYNTILAFPTEEMRDKFYENFKGLIESSKDFL